MKNKYIIEIWCTNIRNLKVIELFIAIFTFPILFLIMVADALIAILVYLPYSIFHYLKIYKRQRKETS